MRDVYCDLHDSEGVDGAGNMNRVCFECDNRQHETGPCLACGGSCEDLEPLPNPPKSSHSLPNPVKIGQILPNPVTGDRGPRSDRWAQRSGRSLEDSLEWLRTYGIHPEKGVGLDGDVVWYVDTRAPSTIGRPGKRRLSDADFAYVWRTIDGERRKVWARLQSAGGV